MPVSARTPRTHTSRTRTGRTGRSASGRPANGRPQPAGQDRAANGRGGRDDFERPLNSTPALPPVASFADLDLPRVLLDALTREGITEPFPIQAATLPNTMAGRDVLGRGRTGSGKTLAFGLTLLARTAGRRAEPGRPLALVLVPTRELAQQVTDALTPYATAVRLRTTTVVGGMSLGRQANALRRGVDVVVATPGRLTDLIERGDCRLDAVEITVLDEADQMADMGFLPQITRLLDQIPAGGQRMLFSATLDRNIDRLVRRFLKDPVVQSTDDASAGTVTTMEHHLLHVTDADKHDTTTHIAAREGRVIMFVGMKHAADKLTRKLLSSGVRAAALHGGKSQSQRNRTLEGFRTGQVDVLVATNVAARGIHVDGLDLVVNVDPPNDHTDYLHRGGRTARAGESGTVVTLVLPSQRREVTRMMATAGVTARSSQVVPGDPELVRITGARAPSGVPVTDPSEASRSRRPSGPSRSASSTRSRGARGPRRDRAASAGSGGRSQVR